VTDGHDLLDGFDPEPVLAPLKDFQRRTVDYAFERLFLADGASRRFLVADEVGLGKTLVARGVIARAIDHLKEDVRRIDVLYVCANQDIARQNLNRINFFADEDADSLCTRITLMPLQATDLQQRRVNFIALTPGTSFDLRSSTGTAAERALIWRMLDTLWGLSDLEGATEFFMCGCGYPGWEYTLSRVSEEELDASLERQFVDTIRGRADLRRRCRRWAPEFASKEVPDEAWYARRDLIAELRGILAEGCVDALEPDLIILDEFQRYRQILDGADEETYLANRLLNWPEAHLLLLSATPYKMYTASGDEEDDHYEDFVAVSRFLMGKDVASVTRLEEALAAYRRGLYRIPQEGTEPLRAARHSVEDLLRRVMVRSERGRATTDEMVADDTSGDVPLAPGDLNDFALFHRVGDAVDGPAPVEYWKSAPYLLNVMDARSYKLKRRLLEQLEQREAIVTEGPAAGTLLLRRSIEDYAEIDPRNGRLRALVADMLDSEAWRLLWIPASMPYYRAEGDYERPHLRDFTKRLVFSSWGMVPRAIATLCSYEAERRMMAQAQRVPYSQATRQVAQLLQFAREGERLTGMPALGTLYPCVTLATELDPLREALAGTGAPPALPDVLASVEAGVREQLSPIVRRHARPQARPDEAWYWAALALLDAEHHQDTARAWLEAADENLTWPKLAEMRKAKEDAPDRFGEHVEEFRRCFDGELELGPAPDDLYQVLAKIALAGPGTVSLRALLRQVPDGLDEAPESMLAGAARMALGFRTLFNLHDVRSMLSPTGGDDRTRYWELMLDHCVAGNLQAVMDEYLHVLRESLGLIDAAAARVASDVSEEVAEVLTLRGAPLPLDQFTWTRRSGLRRREDMRIRCRYALRFGDMRSEEEGGLRRQEVRRAFNSPFRPFILATTSIGQEGLDFHLYCHSICHWNLPSNPVDLEQREGRVNRYKCHAIRRSVARDLTLDALSDGADADPWRSLFAAAQSRRHSDQTDLVPWWVYESPTAVRIQRHVPMLPLSRETQRLPALKRALAAYRMVFGQPRQDDLLEYILSRLDEAVDLDALRDCQIDLSPP